ncbi:hypothetical protein JCM10213_004945 [Rhodosporidiobolus nylandii]
MASITSLRSRQDAIVAQYQENAEMVKDVQQRAISELLPALVDELDLDEDAASAGRAFLRDQVTVFRFCRRARFSPTRSLELLHATLHWRLSSSLLTLSSSALPPPYVAKPPLFFHPSLVDKTGRPCAVLSLSNVQRTQDGSLDGLKDLARLIWEIGRRWLTDLSEEDDKPKLQMVLLVDLEGAGMSNLEVELLPFFMDLLKSHFPGMVGAVFCLNYGWAYAGMWQLAKRVLPKTALERILFPSKEELLEFFDEDHLLIQHGGRVQYEFTSSNSIFRKYGRPLLSASVPSSACPSIRPTPSVSSTSLHTEAFHSAPGTPSLSGRHGGLVMTPSARAGPPSSVGWPWNWGSSSASDRQPESGGGLRRVRSIAELQQRLEQTQREIESDDSAVESVSDYDGDADRSEAASFAASGGSSRWSSRATSRASSREGSPRRRRTREPLKMTSVGEGEAKATELRTVSPYNPSNPSFGYPSHVLDPTGIPHPHHLRRRKRDLIRTLTYLAALRFLALHRYFRYRLNLLVAVLLRVSGLGWWQARRGAALQVTRGVVAQKEPPDRKVHFAQTAVSSPSSSSSSSALSSSVPPRPHPHHHHLLVAHRAPPLFDLDPTVLYLAVLFLLVRTPQRRDKLKRLARFLVVGWPAWVFKAGRAAVLRLLLGREGARGALERLRAARR